MKCRAKGKWWKTLFKHEEAKGAQYDPESPLVRMAPLTVGVRVNLRLATGGGKGTPASRLVWISPSREARLTWTLRTLVVLN